MHVTEIAVRLSPCGFFHISMTIWGFVPYTQMSAKKPVEYSLIINNNDKLNIKEASYKSDAAVCNVAPCHYPGLPQKISQELEGE